MDNPLADAANICFMDTETRAEPHASPVEADVGQAGTYRYAKNSFVVISTWAIGNAPVFDVSLDSGFDGDWLVWSELPDSIKRHHDRVEKGEAWYAAWNASFDRAALNYGISGGPVFEPEMFIDVMAQGAASNLPGKLEHAAQTLGLGGKHPEGQKLINQFCRPNGDTPQSHPRDWETFKDYGRLDTELLRDIFRRTRALPLDEWEDYWVSERINERGIGIDVELAEKAARVADYAASRSGDLLTRWTNGEITKVTQAKRIAEWLYDRLPTEPAMLLVSEWDEGESEADLVASKLSLKRDKLDKLVAYFASIAKERELTDTEQLMSDIVEERLYGGSTSPGKFWKMVDQHDGGRLKNQYVFNGAQQTGRFSSRGVQIHNLTRSSLNEFEGAAIEMIKELKL